MSDEPCTDEFAEMCKFTDLIAQFAQQNQGLAYRRGENGFHILFNESEMDFYFDSIRARLDQNRSGSVLSDTSISASSSNGEIWEALVRSLRFSGVDFEHLYKILPSEKEEDKMGVWDYNFEESIVLGHTLLVVPVMQHYGPLAPKLDLRGPTQKFEKAQPLLAVGMVGDCVKGKFFEQIKKSADNGDTEAIRQRDTLLHPERLQRKMRGLLRALLEICRQSPERGLYLDAVLVGSGAFGGSAKVLAQPFVDSLNGSDLPFDNSKDEVNFFVFPPPAPEDLTLEKLRYKSSLNPKQGLSAASQGSSNSIRVLVAGFDPVSITPHGVLNRAFSAEGQLSHTTDMLERLTNVKGRFVPVRVPKGKAWESPAVFFAKPQEKKFKDEEGYETFRFVPESMLVELEWTEGQQLDANERGEARVWNGDSFEGWILSSNGTEGRSWQERVETTEASVRRSSLSGSILVQASARSSKQIVSRAMSGNIYGDVKAALLRLDPTGKGMIDKDVLISALQKLDQNLSRPAIMACLECRCSTVSDTIPIDLFLDAVFDRFPGMPGAEDADLSAVFQCIDKNGNGTLEKQEILAAAQSADENLSFLLQNIPCLQGFKDVQRWEAAFTEMDTNADGVVSWFEFQRFFSHTGKPARCNGQSVTNMDLIAIFSCIDTNQNGALEKSEVLAAINSGDSALHEFVAQVPSLQPLLNKDSWQDAFDRFDTNSDGVVTWSEFTAFFNSQMNAWK